MQYLMFLWPHSNARYQMECIGLAEAELTLLLAGTGETFEIEFTDEYSVPALRVRAGQALSEQSLRRVGEHSLLYFIAEEQDSGLLRPVGRRDKPRLGQDLPGILKYSGKTNESFTAFLLNAARCSADFPPETPIRALDPMCGRGTTLFAAANRGWDSVGSDVDKRAIAEAESFFKRYLEYHKRKYRRVASSLSIAGGSAANCVRFEYFDSPEDKKAGDAHSLSLARMDARDVRKAFGKKAFHIIAADLPYGVQHELRGNDTACLLREALPVWREALIPGGACAVALNALTLKTELVRSLMDEAGFHVLTGGPYDQMRHFVEQAITRDVAVGVRK